MSERWRRACGDGAGGQDRDEFFGVAAAGGEVLRVTDVAEALVRLPGDVHLVVRVAGGEVAVEAVPLAGGEPVSAGSDSPWDEMSCNTRTRTRRPCSTATTPHSRQPFTRSGVFRGSGANPISRARSTGSCRAGVRESGHCGQARTSVPSPPWR